MSKITVFTKPACVQCNFTKRKLDQLELEYDTIDVSIDEEALAKVKALGYLTAPVVLVEREGEDDKHWGGYQPDNLKALAA